MKAKLTPGYFFISRKLEILSFLIFVVASHNPMICQEGMVDNRNAGNGLRASIVKIDITPDNPQYLLRYGGRKSTGVRDHIYHRILALDDGVTQYFLVSSDICMVELSDYEQLAAYLEAKHNINPLHFWWSATHTHSAPDIGRSALLKIIKGDWYPDDKVDLVYSEWVKQKLIDGIQEAQRQLAPARLGVGWGLSYANINRRAKNANGKAFLGMDPEGAVDRRIGVLRIDKADGTPMACIANYPIHGTVMGPNNTLISGDVPGVVAEYFEEETGVPLLFINGAAGNIAPLYSFPVYQDHKEAYFSQFEILLGEKVVDAYQSITAIINNVRIRTDTFLVETPRKDGMNWPATSGQSSSRRTPEGQFMVKIPIHFLEINEEIAIWTAPLELFCEISNEIRNSSPYPYTFYFGYTNGWMGYLLTEREYMHDGYEPTKSPFTRAAAGDLTRAVLKHLKHSRQVK